ncbi:unnamed protein product [Taenia asiatica]|uniref:HORMA domain-containing protein n=1 Tax=Taenia asiatica TaxID=60517 RepID=A0A0R3W0J6_TAEAS|nr:unnamed protein product [Taenia asiatica]
MDCQLTETLRPTLPYVELGLDLGGSGDGGGGTKADAFAVVAVGGGEGAERWKRWCAQAAEVLPLVVVKQAVVQACRLWSRVFPPGGAPDTVTPAKCRRLHECSQLAVCALFHIGRSFVMRLRGPGEAFSAFIGNKDLSCLTHPSLGALGVE